MLVVEDDPAIGAFVVRGLREAGYTVDHAPDGDQGFALKPVGAFRGLPDGASVKRVLRAIGQPHSRLDHTFTYCAERPSGKVTRIEVEFDHHNRVTRTAPAG